MSRHKVFCVFGGYAVDVSDPNTTVILPVTNAQLPAIDASKLVRLNLHQRLSNAPWDEAILDTTGLNEAGADLGTMFKYPKFGLSPSGVFLRGINVLTVGPVFPGQNLGAIYLERTKFFAEVRPLLDPTKSLWPQPGFAPYELMSSALLLGGNAMRYHGFRAKVVESVGSTKKLSIKQPTGGPKTVTADLSDRTVCDDPALLGDSTLDPANLDHNTAVLTPQSEVDAEGAVFLALPFCVKAELEIPKQPIGGGDV
jgi:hypothetical protein